MVAIDGGHNHDDGEQCAGCRFRQELAEHLEWSVGEDETTWFELTGELMTLMATAMAAITQLRYVRLEHRDDVDPKGAAHTAAAAISRAAGVIEEMRQALMEDEHASG